MRKNIVKKAVFLILLIPLLIGCSSNKAIETDDSLLFWDFENIEEEYISYSFSHFSYACPSEPLPQYITQYLLIKEINQKTSKPYFKVYKYSNYSEMKVLRNMKGGEYITINDFINTIKDNEELNCERTDNYGHNIEYKFRINVNGFKLETRELSLMPHKMELFHKLTCLEEYLKMSLFFREYEATTGF